MNRRWPLVGAALAVGCDPSSGGSPSKVVPPTEDETARCEAESLGESGFDWSCCDVWYRACRTEGRPESECQWICNG